MELDLMWNTVHSSDDFRFGTLLLSSIFHRQMSLAIVTLTQLNQEIMMSLRLIYIFHDWIVCNESVWKLFDLEK